MKISQTVSYAIAALTRLADAGANVHMSCAELCKGTQLPSRYVLQFLRELVSHKVITSRRGVAGGYKLARPASKITLLEIVEAIDGTIGGLSLIPSRAWRRPQPERSRSVCLLWRPILESGSRRSA